MGGNTVKKIRNEYLDEGDGPSNMNTEEPDSEGPASTIQSSDEEDSTPVCTTDSKCTAFEKFQDVRIKKTRKRKISTKKPSTTQTSVKNKFDILTENDDEHDEPKEQETTIKNFPPIVVKTGISFKTFINEVQTYIKSGNIINFRNGRDKISIYTTSIEDFNLVKEKLKLRKYEFHTFTIKEERAKRLVIKGISCEYTPTEVEDELKKLGLNITKVNNMFKAKHTPSNMFLVHFPNSTQLNTVLNSKKFQYVCYQKVQWCKYSPPTNNSVQCYRCQGFGHGSSNCNYQNKCVKCTAIHEQGKCPKTEEQKVQCTNCQGEHPANFRQCPNFVNYVSTLELNRSKPNNKNTNYQRPKTVFTTPNISYSNMTKNMTNFPRLTQQHSTNTTQTFISPNINIPRKIITPTQIHTETPPNSDNFSFEDEVNRLFKCSLDELGPKLDEFLPRLRQSPSDTSKKIMILSFLAQFK